MVHGHHGARFFEKKIHLKVKKISFLWRLVCVHYGPMKLFFETKYNLQAVKKSGQTQTQSIPFENTYLSFFTPRGKAICYNFLHIYSIYVCVRVYKRFQFFLSVKNDFF